MKIILITGLGRSGSTIIQKVLNAHPEIFMSDESWQFLQAAQMYASRNPRSLMGMSDHQYTKCIMQYVISLYTSVAGVSTHVGDKCPPAFTRLDAIKTLVATENGPFHIIWTVRHPYDQALSWIERFQQNSLAELRFYGLQPTSGQHTLEYVIGVLFTVWKMQQEAMRKHPGQIIVYEELTESAADVLRELHSTLGLEYSDAQLQHAFRDKVIGGDPKFSRTNEIHAASKYRFRNEAPEKITLLETAAEKSGITGYFAQYGYTGQ